MASEPLGHRNGNVMKELTVSNCLADYFNKQGLHPIGKFNAFDHVDDVEERTFIVDLAIGPIATKGNRTEEQIDSDTTKFRESSGQIDQAVEDLMGACIFPLQSDHNRGWRKKAIEIENSKSKYFLGSLLAAAIAGRWGIFVVPDSTQSKYWINTVRRMIHKGNTSPIPSNIVIFLWPRIRAHIRC
jgi:hypothetical protein